MGEKGALKKGEEKECSKRPPKFANFGGLFEHSFSSPFLSAPFSPIPFLALFFNKKTHFHFVFSSFYTIFATNIYILRYRLPKRTERYGE